MVYDCVSLADFKEIISDGKTIVKFSASWCTSCKFISLYFNMFERRYKTLKYVQVDIEELSDINSVVEVFAVPSFYFFDQGRVVAYMVGGSSTKLEEFVRKHSSV